MAWSTVPKQTRGVAAYELSSNINSSISLIEKCIDFNIDKSIFISSGGTIYGVTDHIAITKLHAENPVSNYCFGKLTMEKLLHLYHHTNHFNYTIFRVSNAYGE